MQQSQNMNIWEQALKQKNSENTISSQQKTLIVLGNSKSGKNSYYLGKSTLIKLLKTDANVQMKSTVLFEYSYIKKPSAKKQIIHCYELSNKSQKQIIPSLLNKQTYSRTTVVLCVDLSKPENLIQDLKQWMEIIKTQIDNVCNQKPKLSEKRDEFICLAEQGILTGHQDQKHIKPLPIEVVIVGCKYDQYEKQDSENRKWLSRALRYFAHINHCSLFYSSDRSSNTISQLRTVFNELLFGSKKPAYSQKDHLKPIYISRGHDTIQSLNITTSSNASINLVEILRKQINALFSTQDQQKKGSANIDMSKYFDNRIDKMIDQRKKAIAKISKGGAKYSERNKQK